MPLISARVLMPALLSALLLGAGLAARAADAPAPAAPSGAQDFSRAERLLFMTPQLRGIKPPTKLRYRFRRSGSLEAGFEDSVDLVLTRAPAGGCCAARTDFLSGERRLNLPDMPEAEGNPVTLYFLERDVREMQRLTRGSQAHFRKQIRMVAYNGATVRDIAWHYRGKTVAAQEVTLKPYLDDPNRPRFEAHARKEYRFVLSDAVPGGLIAIRTRTPGVEDKAPLLVEELELEGSEPAPAAP
ncbi:conserved exported hypothetical protein [Rubrivivax sp. A210]|uniref:hypothetical protein n=1 Tax=Rubrivivax sp. A210 TaxID=2772301 RepID=UPI0019C6FA3C|nr:hypothetical protein [Rubrivivax sp. A210]CAD5372142.1 conserved exported hypothetical protein [Rubrivivax sp. A210]